MAESRYSFSDYNEYNVLKIPLAFILSAIYLLKYFVILILLPILSKVPKLGTSIEPLMPYIGQFAHQHVNLLLLLPSIPALLVVIAATKRAPTTQATWIRTVWKNARMLLLLAVLLDLFLLTLFLLLGLKHLSGLLIVILYLNAVILLYLLRSKRLPDVLAEFPDYVPSEN
ncbi:DUF2919 family protein [Thioflexithrix psekupsensis]|nr:DUF2919 family protein [Thioflexithrix psekupsensis]